MFIWGSGENKYENILKRAEANARDLKIQIKRPSLSAIDVPVCAENPLRNLYISADGKVSPCVYLYPPLASPFKRIFCGREYWVEKVDFGDIMKRSFPEIWEDRHYVGFRDLFKEREKTIRESYLSLWDSPKMKNIGEPNLPEPPTPCKTCHKILGV